MQEDELHEAGESLDKVSGPTAEAFDPCWNNLDKLIVLKRAAGRPKDLAVVAELQGILERKRHTP